MTSISLTPEEKGIVVFKLCPNMDYSQRLLISGGLIIAGLVLQLATMWLWWAILIFAGNLLLLVRGYNNEVDFGNYSPSSEWQPADRNKLLEIKTLLKKMEAWDRSALDITNPLGGFVFIVICGIIALLYYVAEPLELIALKILAVDIAVLFVPHWITGVRTILKQPHLTQKIDAFINLSKQVQQAIAPDKMQFSLLVKEGGDKALPTDVKMQIKPEGADEKFLGLQGQISLNDVQGTSYIYFYVVLVARQGFGLKKISDSWSPPSNVIKEFKLQNDVEVLVIRQYTTKKSGYHTRPGVMKKILLAGHELTKQVCKGA